MRRAAALRVLPWRIAAAVAAAAGCNVAAADAGADAVQKLVDAVAAAAASLESGSFVRFELVERRGLAWLTVGSLTWCEGGC